MNPETELAIFGFGRRMLIDALQKYAFMIEPTAFGPDLGFGSGDSMSYVYDEYFMKHYDGLRKNWNDWIARLDYEKKEKLFDAAVIRYETGDYTSPLDKIRKDTRADDLISRARSKDED